MFVGVALRAPLPSAGNHRAKMSSGRLLAIARVTVIPDYCAIDRRNSISTEYLEWRRKSGSAADDPFVRANSLVEPMRGFGAGVVQMPW
jgi:hypothetical protein